MTTVTKKYFAEFLPVPVKHNLLLYPVASPKLNNKLVQTSWRVLLDTFRTLHVVLDTLRTLHVVFVTLRTLHVVLDTLRTLHVVLDTLRTLHVVTCAWLNVV